MAAGVAAALTLTGCGADATTPAETVTVTVTASAPVTDPMAESPDATSPVGASPAASPTQSPSARDAQAFTEGFEQVRERLSGPAGVAIMPVGGGRVLAAGETDAPIAWSTSKVPLAIAALRVSRSAQTRSDVTTAIRDSDNPASARLWNVLGGGERAASRMEAVLREAGDGTTEVPPGRSRPPYASFGRMGWSTADAARFAAGVSCLADAGTVLGHMRRVSDTQQWGFWNVDGAAVKGGWGPIDGEYLVRQIAVVPVAGGGSIGAAMTVLSPTFEQGQRDLDVIAEWAAAFAEPMGAGC